MKTQRLFLLLATAMLFALFVNSASAGPLTSQVSIFQLQPHLINGGVYVQTSSSTNGTFCQTGPTMAANSTYRVDVATNAGRAQYSLLLAALLSGKTVIVEIGTCVGGGVNNTMASVILRP